MLLKDGHLLVGSGGGGLTKIDADGNILWHKVYAYGGIESSANFLVQEDDTGYIYTIGNFKAYRIFEEAIGFRKYDAAGNLIYSKMIHNVLGYAFFRPDDLIARDGAAYITGSLEGFFGNASFFIKINTTTASLEWGRLYDVREGNLSFSKILPDASGFILAGTDHAAGSASDTVVLVQTDFNGIPARAMEFTHPHRTSEYARFEMGKDGAIYYGVGAVDYTDFSRHQILAKIDMSMEVAWMKKYKTGYSAGQRMISIKEHRGSLYYLAMQFPDAEPYKAYVSLVRTDLEGDEGCDFTHLTPISKPAAIPVQDISPGWEDEPMAEIAASITMTEGGSMTVTDQCVQESFCDSLNIIPELIRSCTVGDTIVVPFFKNPECKMPVLFESDDEMVKQISVFKGTASFIPLRVGTTKMYATIESACGVLRDSIVIDFRPTAALDLGKDTSVCTQPVTLSASGEYSSYTWSSGSSAPAITTDQPGIYILTATDMCGNPQTDSIVIASTPPQTISLGPDREICVGDTIELRGPENFETYRWTPAGAIHASDNGREIWIRPTADMTIDLTTVTAEGCIAEGRTDVRVYAPLPLDLGTDTSVCEGEELVLGAGTGFTRYRWSNGAEDAAIEIKQTGTYWVDARSAGGCFSRDTINITILDTPRNMLNPAYHFCQADIKEIRSNGQFEWYSWNTGHASASIVANRSGVYTLKVAGANGCNATATTFVTIKNCFAGIAYPNAFSPNQDGRNDQFKPVVNVPLASYQFTIYNRWGEVVFRSTDPLAAWDGRVNGKEQDTGAYLWVCRFQVTGQETQTDKGQVILVR